MTQKNSLLSQNEKTKTTLASMLPGESAEILEVNVSERDLLTELLETGFLPGQKVFCHESFPSLEKLVLQLGSIKVGIRWKDAQNIWVQK